MPSPELIAWITLAKESLLGLAALVAIGIGIYGIRAWKRDLVGKEVYTATKNLVKESHLVSRAALMLREPLHPNEKRRFTNEEIFHTTELERWCISEIDGYKLRISEFSTVQESYRLAKLDLRVLIGSKIYEGFLPFDLLLIDSVNRVNNYLELLNDYEHVATPESPEIVSAQLIMYPSENLDDDLTKDSADAREEGEKSILKYLHRNSIRGYKVIQETS